MTDSILNTIKKLLGVSLEDTAFDMDVLTLINATMSKLTQVGVGPEDPILVVDKDTVWSSLTVNQTILSLCQQYIYMSVRSVFDPPGTSYHLTSAKEIMEETLWRIKEEADPYVLEEDVEDV